MPYKAIFTKYHIMTIQSIILKNVLNFMHKQNELKNLLPLPVLNIISPEAPKYNNLNVNVLKWMDNHATGKLRNTISFKGPLFYSNYVTQFLKATGLKHPCIASINFFKKHTKSFVFNIQSIGSPSEWEGTNTPLYNVPGLPRASRKNIPTVSYKQFF